MYNDGKQYLIELKTKKEKRTWLVYKCYINISTTEWVKRISLPLPLPLVKWKKRMSRVCVQ